ncbi:MAG: FtsX-like permease family protein, partial [Gemmatimonadetes bacterium]
RWGGRDLLLAGQIGLAVVLLVSAGLFVRSIRALQHVDRGFTAERVVTFSYLVPRGSALADDPAGLAEGLLQGLGRLPDVEAAAMACSPPLGGHCTITGVAGAGARRWPEGSRPRIGLNQVSDGFFDLLRVPLLRGRGFGPDDRADAPPVVILSRSAAERLFPDDDALGRRVWLEGAGPPGSDDAGAEVIGVVDDVLYDTPRQGSMPEAYVSFRQDPSAATVMLRTRREPLAVVPAARAIVRELAPDVPVFGVRTLDEMARQALGDTRTLGLLLTVLAGLALAIACAGVTAVVAFSVARRTSELGLRMALGADRGALVRLVVGRGLWTALLGVAAGAGAAAVGTRLLEGALFGVPPTDPAAYAWAAVLLLAVAAVAAWLPARRATRIDPVRALRAD